MGSETERERERALTEKMRKKNGFRERERERALPEIEMGSEKESESFTRERNGFGERK